MQHRKLDRLMTPVERIARVAAAGLTSATSSVTKPSGAKSYDNADGTRTIIGNVANGESSPSYTMATHVGDITAPGTPTGVTASSKSGVVVVEWDGTLTGGVPDDFCCVRVYLDGSELGILTGAGSVSSASLEGGTTHSVTATAEDDACLPDGTPAHNVSAPTAAISVTVSEGVESVAAIAQEALDVAEATGQHFWSDTDGIHVTEVTQDEWQDSTGTSYHSGQNVLINALGQLFRQGLNNLMALVAGSNYTGSLTIPSYSPFVVNGWEVAPWRVTSVVAVDSGGTEHAVTSWTYSEPTLTVTVPSSLYGMTLNVAWRGPSGIAIYDGEGNGPENVLAQFTASIIRLGGKFAASGRSTAKVQFFEDDSALTDLTAEHYLNTTTDPQVSHDLALSSTITDDELPDGAGRTVTGNVEVWEQVYHSGSTYSDEVTASLNGMTSNSQNNVSMGVQAIESSGASSQRIAFVTADTVRLTSGTGRQSVTSDTTMPQVRQALNCRSNTNGWVNSDGYADSSRLLYIGARVNNSASVANGHNVNLYVNTGGMNVYDSTNGNIYWRLGLHAPRIEFWPGTKVMTINGSAFTLFTKAQLQAIVGTDWTPTGANCYVGVMNGEDGVTDAMMNASIDGNSIVRVHMNKTRNGIIRVNYLIVRFA